MTIPFVICTLLYSFKQVSSTTVHPRTVPPTASSPRPGVDFHGPIWLPRSYKITCCRGGTPEPDKPELVANWTQSVSDFAVDETRGESMDEACRVFEGSYSLAAHALFNLNGYSGYGVQCKCPKDKSSPFDKHCRSLPPCQNNGYRSFTLNGRCACANNYFGDYCEKFCDQGQKLKGMDGRDYCSCVPFYQGEECRDMMCLNGGIEMNRRCSCPPNFLGYHCEIDANRTTTGGGRYQRFGDGNNSDFFTRDISGTVFSMIMIIVLIVSMYLLMKHRMQVQHHFSSRSRRDRFSHPVYGSPRRGDVIGTEDPRGLHFLAMGIEGPPPYMTTNRGGPSRDSLPPLPTYEDATKLPPLRPNSSIPISSETPPRRHGHRSRPITQIESIENVETERIELSEDAQVHTVAPPVNANIVPTHQSILPLPTILSQEPIMERTNQLRKSI